MERLPGIIDQHAPAQAKIALFRSLFRGRDDVYPRRFESRKTGKSGYMPACANEWVRGLCEKPRVKCADCGHRRFLPVTDDVIRWHLSGQDDGGRPFVAGVYPMLQDETCSFLAVDFDKHGWRDDTAAFMETCRLLGIPAALERSRSGRGGHVWLFFEEAVPAVLARKLGAHALTETMDRRPDIGLDSYDRFFPNQDTLPQRGFGNLIALPLQKHARAQANSVFVDDQLQPYADQWAFLATIGRIGRPRLDDVVREAERRGRVVGVRLPAVDEEDIEPPASARPSNQRATARPRRSVPMGLRAREGGWALTPSRRTKEPPIVGQVPATLELVLGDEVYVKKEDLALGLRNRLVRLAAFQNPEFYRTQAMRLPTYDKPRIVSCAEEHPHHLGLPRGCLPDVRLLLSDLHIAAVIRDERCVGQSLDVRFQGALRPDQQAAGDALLPHDTGVLAATTAFGKTVVAAWLIAARGVNTLVLVHRRQLLDQWVDRLSTFLGVDRTAIGRIGGGRHKPTGRLDVAVIQSLVRKGVVDDRVADYGHLIVDECHHVSAHSFDQVARRARAKYVLGLSATVTRKDGHHPIIFMQCGPVRHRVSARVQAAARPFTHSVIVRPTAFVSPREPETDTRVQFQALYRELAEDERRNRFICDDVLHAVRDGRSPLVLTERHDHLDRLVDALTGQVEHLLVLKGQVPCRQREQLAEQLRSIPDAEARVLLATGRYIGEGFDDARLDTLFVTLPIPFDGWSKMEVDLLSRELRVAIELDGRQHLADAVAYRRDRHKDRLLREHGYLVLRFLAEDVAKDLDGVLDALLRVVSSRQRRA